MGAGSRGARPGDAGEPVDGRLGAVDDADGLRLDRSGAHRCPKSRGDTRTGAHVHSETQRDTTAHPAARRDPVRGGGADSAAHIPPEASTQPEEGAASQRHFTFGNRVMVLRRGSQPVHGRLSGRVARGGHPARSSRPPGGPGARLRPEHASLRHRPDRGLQLRAPRQPDRPLRGGVRPAHVTEPGDDPGDHPLVAIRGARRS